MAATLSGSNFTIVTAYTCAGDKVVIETGTAPTLVTVTIGAIRTGLNMVGGFSTGPAVIVTRGASTNRRTMVEVRNKPVGVAMAETAIVGGGQVTRRFRFGDRTIVTTLAPAWCTKKVVANMAIRAAQVSMCTLERKRR